MHIIPEPMTAERRNGSFRLTRETAVKAGGAETEPTGNALGLLRRVTGFPFRENGGTESGLEFALSPVPGGDEAYALEVTPSGIRIRASGSAGFFYGAMTLLQLLPPAVFSPLKPAESRTFDVPCVSIEDAPRFPWRGAMLDCTRHFMPLTFIRTFIDLLALHRLNTFHWHLTDDQGWRIEIRKYPLLTERGAWRSSTLVGHNNDMPRRFDGIPHGGFYAQDEVRSLVRYAAERNVRIVPEIEMPGHATAAVAAYPELGNTGAVREPAWTWGIHENIFNASESTIRFLQDVLDEVTGLFPSPFIHVGGDECVKTQWERSAAAQARIRELGVKDEHGLQSWFIGRMDAFLHERGRRLVGWDEILEGGLAPNAAVMSWRGTKGGIAAARAGHDVVMASTTHTYLDYYQSEDTAGEPPAIGGFLPLEKVYAFDPVPPELIEDGAKHVLGSQGQLWTEYMPDPAHVEYMAFPRLSALSEVLWSPRDGKDFGRFRTRLVTHLERLSALGVNYRPL